jgi:asparagine synthase (glutamine-hydrolysing)
MDEAEIAKHFADSVYHCEHHNFDLNSVGKFALSMVPREHGYKVVLTGEGADEHFAGYPFFFPDHLRELDLSLPESPPAVNPQLIKGLQEGADTDMKAIFERTGALNRNWTETDAVRAVNRSTMLSCIVALHPELSLFAPWAREDWVGTDCRDTIVGSLPFPARQKIKEKWHPLHTAEYMWSKTMLANNLLSCLGDRTEMAHSIEARPPFLDHIVSEYINGLPPSVKVAYTLAEKEQKDNRTGLWWQGQGAAFQAFTEKWILRQAGRPFITKELYERRKHPYAAPVRWPRGGPLNRMFEGLLTEEAVDNLGFVDYEVVKAALETSFGDNPDSKSFRTLIFVASWVVISQRFGVKRAGRHGQERRNWKTASYI